MRSDWSKRLSQDTAMSVICVVIVARQQLIMLFLARAAVMTR